MKGNPIMKLTLCSSRSTILLICVAVFSTEAQAELRVPHIFGDNMVLQREKPITVWGWADAGKQVAVEFAGQRKDCLAGQDGRWRIALDPLPACAQAAELTIRSAGSSVVFRNVLVGDVWLLGGQSNMEQALRNIRDGDVEVLSADRPAIRLMTVPLRANPVPLDDFPRIDEYNSWSNVTERKGDWQVCTPETVQLFSAVGYVFGNRIHQVTKVPVGLIDTSWGGTTVEAWISRPALAKIPEARLLLADWDARIAAYDPDASLAELVARWRSRVEKLKAEGRDPEPKPTEPKPSPAVNRNNPGAAYNAIIAPMAGLSVKGVLFYQGINNAVGGARPSVYRKTFSALIPEWRRTFEDENLPFGIIQMVSYGFPPYMTELETRMVSAAPYIREAQLQAHLDHENTGFVCAYDLGHIQMHSPYKAPLGERIARWALATQYDQPLTYKTPLYESMEIDGDRIVVQMNGPIHPSSGGRAKILGFAIAGKDRHFYPAEAYMEGSDRVSVHSEFVKQPVAVRYAWGTRPYGTFVGAGWSGQPVAPFRTDDWQWRDAPYDRSSPEYREFDAWMREQREQAQQWLVKRKVQEAEKTRAELKDAHEQ